MGDEQCRSLQLHCIVAPVDETYDCSEFWRTLLADSELPAPFTLTLCQIGDRAVYATEVGSSVLRVTAEIIPNFYNRSTDHNMSEISDLYQSNLDSCDDYSYPDGASPPLKNANPLFSG